MSIYVHRSLPDYRVAVDGWIDLTTVIPDSQGPLLLLQRKGSAALTIAPSDSADPPTVDMGVILSAREKLTIGARHIWVRGKGAIVGLAFCGRA